MGKRESFEKVVEASTPKPEDRIDRRVFWELRHARLRLAIAENDIAWAQEALVSGFINPDGALQVLDEAMEDVAGVRP